MKKLHLMARDLKLEIAALLNKNNIKKYDLKPVQRDYCFEDPSIPRGKQWVIKVKFSNGTQENIKEVPTYTSLHQDSKGENFAKILGVN